jgi:C4-dicarboxylate-specific signal transduction histidine kinase
LSEKITSQNVSLEAIGPVFSLLRHEMGNPVNSLKVTLEVLIHNYNQFNNDKRLDYLSRSQEQVARLHKFLEAMKVYSRCSLDGICATALMPVWNSFLHGMRLLVTENCIDFQFDELTRPLWVQANGSALSRILHMVGDNAIEAVADSADPVIKVHVSQTNGHLQIAMGDNGCGIAGEHMQKIFTPLFTTKENHAGMGLSVTHRLLTQMGGWLEIDSHHGQGTNVSIWLKMAQVEHDIAPVARPLEG